MTHITLSPEEFGAIFTQRIRHGVFLTTKGNFVNSMWLNWATIGYRWRRYCCTAYIRPSRYTAKILAAHPAFTISIPYDDRYHDWLRICGMNSGADGDKLSTHNILTVPSQKVDAPIIAGEGLAHLECRLLQINKTDPSSLPISVFDKFYREKGGIHDAYVAEIVAAYRS